MVSKRRVYDSNTTTLDHDHASESRVHVTAQVVERFVDANQVEESVLL